MANAEHDEEVDARNVFTSITGTELQHADLNGGVDYRSADGTVAVEVTSVTDGSTKSSRAASPRMFDDRLADVGLQRCWKVNVDERRARFRGLPTRVAPHLLALEAACVGHLNRSGADRLGIQDPIVVTATRALSHEGVDAAFPVPWRCPAGREHRHQVMWAVIETGSATDSDNALRKIEAELGQRNDNVKKLSESGATETHLFVWLDEDSTYVMARAVRDTADMPGTPFGLPTRAPELADAIQQLWVVHRTSRNGWRWDGATWTTVNAVPTASMARRCRPDRRYGPR